MSSHSVQGESSCSDSNRTCVTSFSFGFIENSWLKKWSGKQLFEARIITLTDSNCQNGDGNRGSMKKVAKERGSTHRILRDCDSSRKRGVHKSVKRKKSKILHVDLAVMKNYRYYLDKISKYFNLESKNENDLCESNSFTCNQESGHIINGTVKKKHKEKRKDRRKVRTYDCERRDNVIICKKEKQSDENCENGTNDKRNENETTTEGNKKTTKMKCVCPESSETNSQISEEEMLGKSCTKRVCQGHDVDDYNKPCNSIQKQEISWYNMEYEQSSTTCHSYENDEQIKREIEYADDDDDDDDDESCKDDEEIAVTNLRVDVTQDNDTETIAFVYKQKTEYDQQEEDECKDDKERNRERKYDEKKEDECNEVEGMQDKKKKKKLKEKNTDYGYGSQSSTDEGSAKLAGCAKENNRGKKELPSNDGSKGNANANAGRHFACELKPRDQLSVYVSSATEVSTSIDYDKPSNKKKKRKYHDGNTPGTSDSTEKKGTSNKVLFENVLVERCMLSSSQRKYQQPNDNVHSFSIIPGAVIQMQLHTDIPDRKMKYNKCNTENTPDTNGLFPEMRDLTNSSLVGLCGSPQSLVGFLPQHELQQPTPDLPNSEFTLMETNILLNTDKRSNRYPPRKRFKMLNTLQPVTENMIPEEYENEAYEDASENFSFPLTDEFKNKRSNQKILTPLLDTGKILTSVISKTNIFSKNDSVDNGYIEMDKNCFSDLLQHEHVTDRKRMTHSFNSNNFKLTAIKEESYEQTNEINTVDGVIDASAERNAYATFSKQTTSNNVYSTLFRHEISGSAIHRSDDLKDERISKSFGIRYNKRNKTRLFDERFQKTVDIPLNSKLRAIPSSGCETNNEIIPSTYNLNSNFYMDQLHSVKNYIRDCFDMKALNNLYTQPVNYNGVSSVDDVTANSSETSTLSFDDQLQKNRRNIAAETQRNKGIIRRKKNFKQVRCFKLTRTMKCEIMRNHGLFYYIILKTFKLIHKIFFNIFVAFFSAIYIVFYCAKINIDLTT